jgi:hypothetical protein
MLGLIVVYLMAEPFHSNSLRMNNIHLLGKCIMNMLKKAVLGAAVATGVLMSTMGPAWARPSYETCLGMQAACEAGGDCATFYRLCSIYGLG